MTDDYSTNTYIDYVAPEFATKQKIDPSKVQKTIINLLSPLSE